MNKFRFLPFIVLSLAAIGTVKAELSILPFTKGTFAEIKSQRQNQPFILVFWSESCGYCMKELALLGKIQRQYPAMELITVATDSFLEDRLVQDVLSRSQLDIDRTWVFAEQFPERIYADVYKRWRGELPMTYFFSRDNQEIRHMGIIKEDDVLEWLAEQATQ